MDFSKKTILVTGAAGFIGSHLATTLLKKGTKVIAVDDFNDYYDPKFKENNIVEHLKSKSYSLHRGDITDYKFLQDLFKNNKINHIIHLAARAGVRPSIENPLLYQKVNIEGTQNILELAHKHNIKDLIIASSSSVYGNQKKTPFSEIDSVANPISPYAATKRATELLAYTYHHLFSLNCILLRFFTVYGEAGRPDMAPYLFTKLILANKPINKFGDGTSKRDYTYIDDIIDGIIRCLDKNLGYEIINFGNNAPVSLNEFIVTIEAATGKTAKIKQMNTQPGDVDITYADITKAKKLLNWQPKTSLKQGMNKFINWFKENRI